jgi:hypothetical protein
MLKHTIRRLPELVLPLASGSRLKGEGRVFPLRHIVPEDHLALRSLGIRHGTVDWRHVCEHIHAILELRQCTHSLHADAALYLQPDFWPARSARLGSEVRSRHIKGGVDGWMAAADVEAVCRWMWAHRYPLLENLADGLSDALLEEKITG